MSVAREFTDAAELRRAMREVKARLYAQPKPRDIINLKPPAPQPPGWRYAYTFPIGPTVTGEPLSPQPTISVKELQHIVAVDFDLDRADLISQRRTTKTVFARQLAIWRCSRETMLSVAEIGRRFGGRDHTTALHAIRKISALHKAGLLADTIEKMKQRRV